MFPSSQDAFENYAQSMNWGFDQSFQMVAAEEADQDEAGNIASGNTGFSFGPFV